jgi:alpha-L-fucosidase
VEIDVPLLKNKGHKWFWAQNTDSLILTTDQLMNTYYKSVGRGAVLLLNSTPDTLGLIPKSHVKAYAQFGKEIKRRFENPIGKTKGVGKSLEISFSKPTVINHAVLQEDLSRGQRVLAFDIEGMNEQNQWNKVYDGTSLGHKRICYFNPVNLKKIRVLFTNTKAEPQITSFAVYNIKGLRFESEKKNDLSGFYDGIAHKNGTDPKEEQNIEIGKWDINSFINAEWKELSIDLTKYVTRIGQYEVTFSALNNKESGLEFLDWEIEMYGRKSTNSIELLNESSTFRITRSQQTLDEFPTILRLKIKVKSEKTTGKIIVKRVTY